MATSAQANSLATIFDVHDMQLNQPELYLIYSQLPKEGDARAKFIQNLIANTQATQYPNVNQALFNQTIVEAMLAQVIVFVNTKAKDLGTAFPINSNWYPDPMSYINGLK